jgi:phosphate starvation-inducible membrane PsiE
MKKNGLEHFKTLQPNMLGMCLVIGVGLIFIQIRNSFILKRILMLSHSNAHKYENIPIHEILSV